MDGIFGAQLLGGLGGNNQNGLLTGLLLAGMMRGNGTHHRPAQAI